MASSTLRDGCLWFGQFSSKYESSRLSCPNLCQANCPMHISSFVSFLATVIWWVPQHLLMLQLGYKNFNLFYPQWWKFCLPLSAGWEALQYTMAMADKLTCQSAVRFGHTAQHNLLSASMKKKKTWYTDNVLSKLLCEAALVPVKNSLYC